MVMLDLFAQKVPRFELVIAHFDHGVRKNSKEDADFVRRRAEEYGIGIVVGRGELGENASEEQLAWASLEKHVTKDTPPAFLWQTLTDELVPVENSSLYVKACRAAGVPCELHLFMLEIALE